MKHPEQEKLTIKIWARKHGIAPETIISHFDTEVGISTRITRGKFETILEKINKEQEDTLANHAKRRGMDVEELINIVDPAAAPSSLYPTRCIKEILAQEKKRKKPAKIKKTPTSPEQERPNKFRFIISKALEPELNPPIQTIRRSGPPPKYPAPVRAPAVSRIEVIDELAMLPHDDEDDDDEAPNDYYDDVFDAIQRGAGRRG